MGLSSLDNMGLWGQFRGTLGSPYLPHQMVEALYELAFWGYEYGLSNHYRWKENIAKAKVALPK